MNSAINYSDIKQFDSADMFSTIKDFPQQVRHAIEIGKECPVFKKELTSNKFAILGMGGSAIGGDLLRSYCNALPGAEHLKIEVFRNYTIPANIDKDTNIIISSYSGNTEETISALQEAVQRFENIICITTGGKIEEMALAHGLPIVKLPSGFQPRCALGYSFFAMLGLMLRCGAFKEEAINETTEAFSEMLAIIDKNSVDYADYSGSANLPRSIAAKLTYRIPIIYSSVDVMDVVNVRWRGQIQENAKALAFGNLMPEMNHNEINCWSFPEDMRNRFTAILLTDVQDHPRTKIRMDFLENFLLETVKDVIVVSSNGKHLLSRQIELVYMADWVSYYLAIMNRIDPTPIPLITKLKTHLSRK